MINRQENQDHKSFLSDLIVNPTGSDDGRALDHSARSQLVLALSAVLIGLSWLLPGSSDLRLIVLATGATMIAATTLALAGRRLHAHDRRVEMRQARTLVQTDRGVALLTDRKGWVLAYSPSARKSDVGKDRVTELLSRFCADPDGVLGLILREVERTSLYQRPVTWDGCAARLNVQSASEDLLIWRLESPPEQSDHPVLERLKLAVMETDASGTLVWRNEIAKQMFDTPTEVLEPALAAVKRSGRVHVLPGSKGNIECHVTRQSIDGGLRRYTMGEVWQPMDDTRLRSPI